MSIRGGHRATRWASAGTLIFLQSAALPPPTGQENHRADDGEGGASCVAAYCLVLHCW